MWLHPYKIENAFVVMVLSHGIIFIVYFNINFVLVVADIFLLLEFLRGIIFFTFLSLSLNCLVIILPIPGFPHKTLTGGFSLDSECQEILSDFQDFSDYSSRSWSCCGLYGINSSSERRCPWCNGYRHKNGHGDTSSNPGRNWLNFT